MRRVVLLLIVLCLGFAPAPVYRERPGWLAADLKAMQGEWIALSMIQGGGDAAEPEGRPPGWRITGNVITQILASTGGPQVTITLGGTDRQKTMDLEIAGVPPGRALYRLDGDILIVALGRSRPTDFSGKGRNSTVMTMKRRKI
jgi:uncharacterized protein (TIGR03067 family)